MDTTHTMMCFRAVGNPFREEIVKRRQPYTDSPRASSTAPAVSRMSRQEIPLPGTTLVR
jgi:hypothetical protein